MPYEARLGILRAEVDLAETDAEKAEAQASVARMLLVMHQGNGPAV
jgi:hypothetical protein